MSNKKIKKTPKPKVQQKEEINMSDLTKPWMSMRTGIIIMIITSIGMAVLTFLQVYQSKGILLAILWGLIFGAIIWAIFWGFYFIRRILAPKG